MSEIRRPSVRLSQAALVLVLALPLAGCLDLLLRVDLRDRESGSVEFHLGISSMLVAMAPHEFQTIRDSLPASVDTIQGVQLDSVWSYARPGFSYHALSVRFTNLEALASLMSVFDGPAVSIDDEKKLHVRKGIAELRESAGEWSDGDLSVLSDARWRYEVLFPEGARVGSTNGSISHTDGRAKVAWTFSVDDLISPSDSLLHASATLPSGGGRQLLAALVAVLAIAGVGLTIRRVRAGN